MKILYHPIVRGHKTKNHSENNDRIDIVLKNVNEEYILAKYLYLCQKDLTETSVLNLIHSQDHIDTVKNACISSAHLDGDTPTSDTSFEAAVGAVNLTIAASESFDFALTRPPGHHAYPTKSTGFCLFNNVAVATQKLVNQGKRVAIIDFDGHYGDVTAECFYNTDKVLFCSLHEEHQFPHGLGTSKEIGVGVGQGFTINVPLLAGSGDDEFLNVFKNIFIPKINAFKPDVIALSAGFDAHENDPLLGLNVTSSGYYKLGLLLRENFTQPMFGCLEGGYNSEALLVSLINFIKGINGEKLN